MSEPEMRAAWLRRVEERFRNPVSPSPLHVHYHAALLPGWQGIVREQLDLLRFCGLTDVRAGCLGPDRDVAAVEAMARERGLRLCVVYASPRLDEYETPTLQRLWASACAEPSAAFLYLHTKGASAPASLHQRRWRRAMQRWVVAAWREGLELLATYDLVGANWQELPQLSHFQGNFWMARGDWLASLEDPAAYRDAGLGRTVAGQPWSRMHAETWVGSRPFRQVRSLVGTNLDWWRNPADLDPVPVEVDGFSYAPYDG